MEQTTNQIESNTMMGILCRLVVIRIAYLLQNEIVVSGIELYVEIIMCSVRFELPSPT